MTNKPLPSEERAALKQRWIRDVSNHPLVDEAVRLHRELRTFCDSA